MATVSISLSKAMKLKNRLAGRLVKTQQAVQHWNSVVKSQEGQVDVAALDSLRAELVAGLVTLKTEIDINSSEIKELLYLIAEKKSEIDFLNGVNTRCGLEASYGANAPVEYVATIKVADVGNRVKKLEAEIDSYQDKIDAYNSVPGRLIVPVRVIELAS